MLLGAGQRLGPYQIVAPLGAGGMGEVYKAEDTRLDRHVAIKVLPPALAGDADFKARFEREARSISALNHPHICVLYDVGSAADLSYLVMEYLEGETLADRLKRGPIPIDQALAIASQIADALDKAHRRGIIHRDLKPANVFLVKSVGASGTLHCKLLDFGLAKTRSAAAAAAVETRLGTGETTRESPDNQPITAAGSILGTLPYMSPEQVEGHDTDARTDIWAFGCVLYEMITGRRPFEGRSQASLIASIIERQPTSISELQPLTPPAIGRIVHTCLEKNPDNRFHTAHDLWLHLQWMKDGGSAVGLAAPVMSRTRRSWLVFAAVGLALVAMAAAGAWALKPAPAATPGVVSRFTYRLPDGVQFTRGGRQTIAIAPDGTAIAFIANSQIYLRKLGELEAQPINGTTVDPLGLTFSPDGQSLAFFVPTTANGNLSSGNLKRVAITGGALVSLCPAANPFGLVWQRDQLIYSDGSTIYSIADTGGKPEVLLALQDPASALIAEPQLVDSGRRLIYALRPRAALWDAAQIVIEKVGGGDRRVLVQTGTDGRLMSAGYLLYASASTLFAQRLTSGLEPMGGPVPLVEGVQVAAGTSGVAKYGVSENGTLIFASAASGGDTDLVWVDRKGTVEKVGSPAQRYEYPRVSPDGSRIAVSDGAGDHDIFIWDSSQKLLNKITEGPDDDSMPIWTPDGRSVIFRSVHETRGGLYKRAADGSGAAEQLSSVSAVPYEVLADGRILAGMTPEGRTNAALAIITPGSDVKPKVLIPNNLSRHFGAALSPDGRWLAYTSNEGATVDQVHVRPFPNVAAGHWQISGPSTKPAWSRSGNELFYVATTVDGPRLFVVPVKTSAGSAIFTYGPPTMLLDVSNYTFTQFFRPYDLSRDDQKFLVVMRRGSGVPSESITIVSNWFEELKNKMKAR